MAAKPLLPAAHKEAHMPRNSGDQPSQTARKAAEQQSLSLPACLKGRLAAPSFVLPAGVAENVRFLAGKVDEVGLCFFETQACLNYGPHDLPPDLATLPLRWHVHLPVDLPWPAARSSAAHPAREAAQLALAVLDKALFLQPRCAVLHPPQGLPQEQCRLLAGFAHHWKNGCDVPLLLENVAHSDIAALGREFLLNHELGLCLDVGHLLGYAQENLLLSSLPEQAGMVHWSAPGDGDRHLPLTAFTPPQAQTAAALMARFSATAIHMVEIFNWDRFVPSLPVLEALAQEHAGRCGF